MSVDAPLLAFDTSTERLAVAARGPRGAFGVNAAGGPAASRHLLPQIHAVLAQAGAVLPDVAAIGFGRGPGAFTGLRTSCAVAQGLGFALARPLLALDSLLVVAEDAFAGPGAAGGGCFAVAADARMDEVYGAVYVLEADWRALREPALYTLPAWNAQLEDIGASLHGIAGSALNAFGTRLHRPAGVAVRENEADRASALLRLAVRAHAAGRVLAPEVALPLYLRDKVALTTAEREAARAAQGVAA
jgi:tRNA threonylcarbamoyladenosine biosynthesis protein TsaB